MLQLDCIFLRPRYISCSLFGEGPKIKGPARPGQHIPKPGYNMMLLGCICYIWAAYAAPRLLHLECNSHQCNTRIASGLHMLQLDCIFGWRWARFCRMRSKHMGCFLRRPWCSGASRQLPQNWHHPRSQAPSPLQGYTPCTPKQRTVYN